MINNFLRSERFLSVDSLFLKGLDSNYRIMHVYRTYKISREFSHGLYSLKIIFINTMDLENNTCHFEHLIFLHTLNQNKLFEN